MSTVYAIKLPDSMSFHLDGRDHPVARLQNGRVFPLKHPLVEALLFKHFTQEKHRCPTREEMQCLLLQCTAKAVEEVLPEEQFLEEFQEQETVIQAVLVMLADRQFKVNLPFSGSLTALRQELEAYAGGEGLDTADWPKRNHFGEYLLKTLGPFWPRYNVRIKYRRTNIVREYEVNWITPPPKKRPVTRRDATEGRVTSPPPPHEEDAEALKA